MVGGAAMSSPMLEDDDDGLSAFDSGCGFGADWEMGFCSGGGR